MVLLFGAQKISKLARSTGQALGEFKKGREEIEEELQELDEEVREEIEGPTEETPVQPKRSTSSGCGFILFLGCSGSVSTR